MSPLEIPKEAITVARDVALRKQSTRASVEAAAPLIVAAELERIAETLHTSCRIDDLIGTAEAGARNGVRNELLARAAELRGDRKAEVGHAARPAVCDHEPTPDIAEAVARLAAGGQYNSARKLLHDNSRLTWEEVVARVDRLASGADA